ncbi:MULTISPECIES: hypothetical protein [unclassified Pseudomonas]|nr:MULTISPECIES: hypothetical protein [unclassified Pseudomonas]
MSAFVTFALLLTVAGGGQIAISHRRSAHRRTTAQAYRSGAAQ